MEPKFVECNCDPELDPYHSWEGRSTWTKFYINLENGRYGICQDYDDNSTPEPEWNNRIFTANLDSLDEDEAKTYITSENFVSLVQEVLDNSEIAWDGNNMRGVLNDEGLPAWNQLMEGFWELKENKYSLCSCGDWLSLTPMCELGIDGTTTDEEIETIAETIEEEARENETILYGDLEEYLREQRDDLKSDNE